MFLYLRKDLLKLGWLPLLIWALPSCTTVSETGRSQFNFIPASQELQMGIQSFSAMKEEMPISKDPKINEMVTRVGKRIAEVANLPNAEWEFVVFESEQANAFALPGGKVGIYTGILSITKDEAGLATVISHEVAHASKNHGAERMSRALAIQFGGSAISALLSGTAISDNRKQAVTTVYGLGMNLGVALPNSRVQESEADQIGLLYMARAGYDPAQAVEFWKRFKEINDAQGSSTPWFLRTHPLDQTRIDQLQEWLPAAKREYRARN